jgi:hypothetical protein
MTEMTGDDRGPCIPLCSPLSCPALPLLCSLLFLLMSIGREGIGTASKGGGLYRRHSHDGNGIVVEDGRDVFGGELVCRVTDQKTCLTDSTITDDHTPKKQSR